MDGAMEGSMDEAYWRERAGQLQHALTARISVEQAKGILAERLGLDMDGAFALLRYAARGERLKVHDLARSVVESDGTPEPVIRALAKHTNVLGKGAARVDRIVQTELFFRAINEEISRSRNGATTVILCECGNPACAEALELDGEVLERLYAERGLFAVLAGHEIPDVETVVERSGGYLLVRKETLED